MYQSFTVKNFRCFDNLTLDNLQRVNLIAGKNNVGKTALLEAILLHTGHYDAELILRMQSDRDDERPATLRPNPRSIPTWNMLFGQLDASNRVTLEGSYKVIQRNQQPTLFPIDEQWVVELSIIDRLEELSDQHIAQRLLRTVRDFDLSTQQFVALEVKSNISGNFTSYYMMQHEGRIYSDFRGTYLPFPTILLPSRDRIPLSEDAKRFSELDISGKLDLLLEILRIVEPRLTSVRLLYRSGPPTLHGDIGLKEPIPLTNMGEGLGRITSLVLAIGNAPNGVILIDEIENGLHYSVLKEVWKAIAKAAREFNTQVFATTHSWECIVAAHRAFSEDSLYDFRLHRLEQRKDGRIHVVGFEQDILSTSIETGLEVR